MDRQPTPEAGDVGNQDQSPPEPVDHRGHRGQQVDHRAEQRGQAGGGVVADEEGDTQGDGEGQEQGQAGNQNGAENQRAHITQETAGPSPAQGKDGLGAGIRIPGEGRKGPQDQKEGDRGQSQQDQDARPGGTGLEDPVHPFGLVQGCSLVRFLAHDFPPMVSTEAMA